MSIKDQILDWAGRGGDFRQGISLFLSFNRNVFYVRNIELKGEVRGTETLIAEFCNKIHIPASELRALIENPNGSSPVAPIVPISFRGHQREARSVTTPPDEQIVKPAVKLREEFAFLSQSDCPAEFAILVNRMITAYEQYRGSRTKLFEIDPSDVDACYRSAREVLDPYIENRLIWDELHYYKTHGKILGRAPEFADRKQLESYTGMKTSDLIRISTNNIPRKMSYYKKLLAQELTKNKDEIREKMNRSEREICIIRGILRQRGELE